MSAASASSSLAAPKGLRRNDMVFFLALFPSLRLIRGSQSFFFLLVPGDDKSPLRSHHQWGRPAGAINFLCDGVDCVIGASNTPKQPVEPHAFQRIVTTTFETFFFLPSYGVKKDATLVRGISKRMQESLHFCDPLLLFRSSLFD